MSRAAASQATLIMTWENPAVGFASIRTSVGHIGDLLLDMQRVSPLSRLNSVYPEIECFSADAAEIRRISLPVHREAI